MKRAKQARMAGADAIIDIQEQRTRVGETLILHVSAIGIRYTDDVKAEALEK